MGDRTILDKSEYATYWIDPENTSDISDTAERILSNSGKGIIAKSRLRRDTHALEAAVHITEGPALDDPNISFRPLDGHELAGFVTEKIAEVRTGE